MAVAYILEQNASIACEGERLLVKKGGSVLHTLHLFKLDQLVMFGHVALTPQATHRLLRDGVDTVFMTAAGRYRGRLEAPRGKNITLRIEQFRRLSDPEFSLQTARAIVAGKIQNLRGVVLRLNRSREGLALEDQILSLKRLAEKAESADEMDSLRGFEGRAAVVYFEGFARGFLADGVVFERRVRRPPTDPVNALLSLGYTLLLNTVLAACSQVGLDPYLGCLHTVEYGRPSLALDLMEEWRPIIVDSLVLSVFNLKAITLQDFVKAPMDESDRDGENEDGAFNGFPDEAAVPDKVPALPVKLTDAGFRRFIAQFERKAAQHVRYHLNGQNLTYRDCIREQLRHFARYLRGEEPGYQPMPLR
ncbi:MAG TPA: CRISPR-associated endonuclease Cas1 [Syntrophobacteraceae bacterium]|nr:CRISPR-associated endonuclease Cas1 [Syntrophobacteraceae bacterium]